MTIYNGTDNGIPFIIEMDQIIREEDNAIIMSVGVLMTTRSKARKIGFANLLLSGCTNIDAETATLTVTGFMSGSEHPICQQDGLVMKVEKRWERDWGTMDNKKWTGVGRSTGERIDAMKLIDEMFLLPTELRKKKLSIGERNKLLMSVDSIIEYQCPACDNHVIIGYEEE